MGKTNVIQAGSNQPAKPFSRKRLEKSIISVCLSLRTPEGQAEEIAESVSRAVLAWCKNKPEVTSTDIRRVATGALEKYHPEAAYLYKQQTLIL